MDFVNLRLPPLTSRVLRVKFHPHEQEKYNMFQCVLNSRRIDFSATDTNNSGLKRRVSSWTTSQGISKEILLIPIFLRFFSECGKSAITGPSAKTASTNL